MNNLPPGLRGYMMQDQIENQKQAQQLSMLAQLAQLKGAEEDRGMRRQMLPLEVEQKKAALAKLVADAQQAKDKAAFFSPENRQQYVTGGRPEITLPETEQGPVSPAVPGKMDFSKFLQDAASRGVVNPEVYANHVAQQEQKKIDAEQRATAKRDELTQRAELAREKMRQDFELAKQRAEDKRSSDADKIEARKEMMRLAAALRQPQRDRLQYDPARGGTLNLDTNEFKPAVGPGGEPIGNKPTPEKAMPASAVRSLMENQQNLRKAESALSLLQEKTPGGDAAATGWKGMLAGTEVGDQMLQRVDPKGVNTRAAISDLGSMIIHDRSGAAVTAAEYPRLRPFIPKVTDDKPTAEKKLKRFVTEYRHIQQESVDFFTESGYKVPVNSLRPPATPTSGPIQAPQRRASDAAPVLRFDAQGNQLP